MADITLSIVGAVGVALDVALTTYDFVSSIIQAPPAILTLADHINTLKSFLQPFYILISKPVIHDRAQNIAFLAALQNATIGFHAVLKDIEEQVSRYVRYPVGSDKPVWGGRSSIRRLKYAANKKSLHELEAGLLGRMAALHLAIAPMDL